MKGKYVKGLPHDGRQWLQYAKKLISGKGICPNEIVYISM
jgi:hypothetical protein